MHKPLDSHKLTHEDKVHLRKRGNRVLNKVILMGRLTRDPEIRRSQGENAMTIASFSLAVDRATKKKEGNEQTADFINCVALGKNGEFAEKYLHKGTKVIVEGHIQTGSYTNRDGKKVYTTDVYIERIEFAESKSTSENNSQNVQNTSTAAPNDGFMNIPDNVEDAGLPFN